MSKERRNFIWKLKIAFFVIPFLLLIAGSIFEKQLIAGGYMGFIVLPAALMIITALLLGLYEILSRWKIEYVENRRDKIIQKHLEPNEGKTTKAENISKKLSGAIKKSLLFIAVLVVSIMIVSQFRGYYSDDFENFIIGIALAGLIAFVWQKIAKRYLD